LRGRSVLGPFAQGAGDALLQNLHNEARCADFRFADEKMNMLRHDHVPEQREIVAIADFSENCEEEIAAVLGSEEWETSIATAGDEVEMSEAVAALEFGFAWRHAPLIPQGVRHPHNFYSGGLCDVLCGGSQVASIRRGFAP
jgi:hypothetical protein